jgi:hypothetical protein
MPRDPLDAQLRDRLDALLAAVPPDQSGAISSLAAGPRPRVVGRSAVGLTGVTVGLVAVVIAALALNRPLDAGGPVTALATEGPFRLTITIPHRHYAAGKAIAGITASLEYTGSANSVSIAHAKELIGFAVASEDGQHRTEPAWAQSCGRSDLSAAAPASAAFAKSGGYFPEESDFPWLQAYFSNQSLVLDAGKWTITAVAIAHHYGPTRFDTVVPVLGGPAVPMP